MSERGTDVLVVDVPRATTLEVGALGERDTRQTPGPFGRPPSPTAVVSVSSRLVVSDRRLRRLDAAIASREGESASASDRVTDGAAAPVTDGTFL